MHQAGTAVDAAPRLCQKRGMTKLIFVAHPGPAGSEDAALLDVWDNLNANPDGARLFQVDSTSQIKDLVKSVYIEDGKVGVDAVMIVGHGAPGLLTLRKKPTSGTHTIWFDSKNSNVSNYIKNKLAKAATIQLVACSVAADELATPGVDEGQTLIGSLAARAKVPVEATICSLPSNVVTAAGATGIAILTAVPDLVGEGMSTIMGDMSPEACAGVEFTAPPLELDESRYVLMQEYFPDVKKLVWDSDAPVFELARHLFAATRWRTHVRHDAPPLSMMLFSTGSRYFCAFESEPGTLPAVEVPPETLPVLSASLPSVGYAKAPGASNGNNQQNDNLS